MISLVQLSELFEKELNTILNNPEIQFKIWSEVGQYKPYYREGNIVTHYINGNLRTSTSANDANALVMGVNGLSLTFSVPVKQPRTNANQTSEELQEIKDGQFPFVNYIASVINSYFQTAKSTVLVDENGKKFSVSWQAGTSVGGAVDLVTALGKCIEIDVYIEMYFIEGGTNSKDVKIYFDGSLVPYRAIRHGRSPMLERDVYADNLVSKSVITSTAFAIDIDFPSNSDKATEAVINYLLSGEPNVAHFVTVEWGETNQELFLMTINTVQTSAQGVAVAGLSVSLIEPSNNVFNVPEGYQVGTFTFVEAEDKSVTFSVTDDCSAFIAGKAIRLVKDTLYKFDIDLSYLQYEAETETYYVYLVTDKTVSVANAVPAYIQVKAGV